MECKCDGECFCDNLITKMGVFWTHKDLPSFNMLPMEEIVEQQNLFRVAQYYLTDWAKNKKSELPELENCDVRFKEFMDDKSYSVHIYCYTKPQEKEE